MNHNFGDKGSVADQKHFVWLGSHILFMQHYGKVLLSRRSNMDINFSSVVDPYTLNLDPDPSPGFWPNRDLDPGPDPDPGLYNQCSNKK